MEKTKKYKYTHFSADVLSEAGQAFRHEIDPEAKCEFSYILDVSTGDAEWSHDSIEEFMADYRKSEGYVYFVVGQKESPFSRLVVSVYGSDNDRDSLVRVQAPDRPKVEAVFGVFEKHVDNSRLPIEPPKPSRTKPTVFIGHGHSPLWRDLKDHLQDKHDYEVEAYEVGARAGHGIRDILTEMLKQSTFAVLVMTGEDETKDNRLQPRLNVVHELGLFQGRLGFSRAIMLLEEETQEFSNMDGVHQIRFSKGNIKETFGEVLATLHREFPRRVD